MRSLVLVALFGCDSLAGRDYVGEPLFTLSGTVAATTATQTEPVGGLALLWQDPRSADGPGAAATTVPVALTFPSTFRIAVPVPPPASVRFAFADADIELAEAFVFLVSDPGAPELVARGAERNHVLVYASGDVAAGTLAADYLGGALAAGYHLRKLVLGSPGAAQNQMIERCVANGAARAACTTRRSYQLLPAADDAALHIVVTP